MTIDNAGSMPIRPLGICTVALIALSVLLIVADCGPKYEPGQLKWSYETEGAIGKANPAIAPDGTVYCGSSDGHLYALTAEGKLKWRFGAGGAITTNAAIADDGTIYFGAESSFYAVNPDSTLKWRFPTHAILNYLMSPAIALDGTIYCPSWDEHLYALSPDGTLKWKNSLGGGDPSPVAIGPDGTIYVSTASQSNCTYAIDTSGETKWSGGTGTMSAPAIGSDTTIYVLGSDLIGCDPADLHTRLDFPRGGTSSPVIGADGTIYYRDWYCLLAVKTEGTIRWEDTTVTDESWYLSNTPAVASDGVLYHGGKDGYFRAWDSDGVPLWEYQTGGAVKSSPVIGKDGTVYFGSDDGFIYALQGTGNLAGSPWPVLSHDARRTGRFGAE